MASLRECLAGKLADPEFRAGYDRWCEACAATMALIERIEASGMNVPELARLLQLAPERIEALIDAECCEYEVVSKLCTHFGLRPPTDCPRRDARQP